MSVDDRLQELLERLGRTLGEALAESDAAADVVEAARQEGVCLYLRLEPHRNEDGSRGLRLVPAERPREASAASPPPSGGEARPGNRSEEIRSDRSRSEARLRRARLRAQTGPQAQRARYRLEQQDVDFLRALGIDPSRTGRSSSGRGRS